jgi:hypothetical protein
MFDSVRIEFKQYHYEEVPVKATQLITEYKEFPMHCNGARIL